VAGDSAKIVRRLLEARGIADVDAFLNPSISGLEPPEGLPGIVQAADIALDAVASRRRIVVFGDYDCDGICATAILVKTLRAIAGDDSLVVPFLPERLTEGYGMSDASVARCLAENGDAGLVITVDNGINSLKQIAALKEKGVQVVVTDHHLASRAEGGGEGDFLLPPADVVVNPKVASPDSFFGLCGAGVAFLLANRITTEARRMGLYGGPGIAGPLLVLAGLATVTDIMPLLGQNRIFVSEALSRFRTLAPVGLKELYLRAARSGSEKMTSRDFGFILGPRINAAGRLHSGMEALKLVLSGDREEARELARVVDGYNAERKAIEQAMTNEAMGKVVADAPAQVIDLPSGHPGVAGIVAARVLECMGGSVPVCIIANGHGSARSPEGVNIRDAFVACDAFLEKYGGHAAACGFTVKEGKVDAFRDALCEYCRGLGATAAKSSSGLPELWLSQEEATLELADDVARMEPFGEGNPEPVFGMRGVALSDVRHLGQDGRHLSFYVGGRSGGARMRGVWWNGGERIEELRSAGSAPHDIAFNITVSDYGGRHAELKVVDADWQEQ